MANQNKLKAYVRYDGTGRVIAGGPILQRFKPAVGNWVEINANECCNEIPTTTTTTTQGGVTPTAFIQGYYLNTFNACNGTLEGSLLFYSASSTVSAGISVFTDAALTIPVTEGYVIAYQVAPMVYITYLVGPGGVLSTFDCETTTTTTTTAAATYTIGQEALGGIIAYINGGGSTGTSGLVVTSSDVSSGAQWGCSGTDLAGASGTAIGTGEQNTVDIVTECATVGIAAQLCLDLTDGGYSDWYLPSKDELNALYVNRSAIGGFPTAPNSIYHSSSENNASSNWSQDFSDGTQYTFGKTNSFLVRAIRSF